ncbi:hypothetical protein CFAM422_004217 [Trichoderma lentiforme]|uniref:Uncharacterized protein n=1 Tax=Trichoderma lentiforme TaxID=1567552 RepID=A0A9P4XJ75_9HYPO|nr:hypothetical protein CFAM422_004217 [Trichoderma lentiforme]
MYQLYSLRPMGNYSHWTPYDDDYEHPAVDSDMSIGQAYPTDEATPILDGNTRTLFRLRTVITWTMMTKRIIARYWARHL